MSRKSSSLKSVYALLCNFLRADMSWWHFWDYSDSKMYIYTFLRLLKNHQHFFDTFLRLLENVPVSKVLLTHVSAFPFFPFSKSRPSWSAHRGAPTHRGVPTSRGAHHSKKNITESACARSCSFFLALGHKVARPCVRAAYAVHILRTRVRPEFNSSELDCNSGRTCLIRMLSSAEFGSTLTRV